MLSSARATSRSFELALTNPVTKNVCKADSAAEVIGPVESGERMIAKKGLNSVVSGRSSRSTEVKSGQ